VTVSFNSVVLQSLEAQRNLSALQSRFAPREAQLKVLSSEVDELRKQLAPTNNLGETDRTARERTLESKEKQLQREAEDLKTDSQTEADQVFQRVAQKVYAFLQTFAQQHGYSLVVERGSDANPVVWYAAANLDITDEAIKAYNAQAGGTTVQPNPPAGPKTPPDSPRRQ
jgi:outer membrane protein